MNSKALKHARKMYGLIRLPRDAKVEYLKDRIGGLAKDPGLKRAIDEAARWLCRAQDNSLSQDGGVASHYSLINGWSASYPETTGYIISTMLDYGKSQSHEEFRRRAKKMLDWLVSIQLECGGFQGGLIDSKPVVPVTFNSGQILLGLACGVREFGDEYLGPMRRAADWLVETQDPDGCWRKYPTPFAAPGEKAYETHVAWALLEAARFEPGKGYAESALKNIRWALGLQKENGWFEKCCLADPMQPLTHTLGYVLRGLIEGYRYTRDQRLLDASRKTADGLLTALREDGFIPGRLNQEWKGTARWSCLTGSAQISCCWLMLYEWTGNVRYRNAAFSANGYLRRTLRLDARSEMRGAIKGSLPIDAEYFSYEYPNWATKFFIDANLLEENIKKQTV